MMIRRLTLLLTLSAALAVAGCAGDADSGEPAAAPPATTSAPSSDPSTPGLPESTDLPQPSKGGPGAAGARTISGTVTAGVEPNCLLLTSDGENHLLVFDNQSLRTGAKPGSTITVTGRADPAMMTTCQQGTPFIVTDLKPAS